MGAQQIFETINGPRQARLRASLHECKHRRVPYLYGIFDSGHIQPSPLLSANFSHLWPGKKRRRKKRKRRRREKGEEKKREEKRGEDYSGLRLERRFNVRLS